MEKKKFEFPHTFLILLGLAALVAIFSYVVPASTYDMVKMEGRNAIDVSSWHIIEQTPISPTDFLLAIPAGFTKQANIIFMVLIIAGAIEIINKTQAIDASIGRLAFRYRDRLNIVVPLLLAAFIALGSIGVSTASIAFVPLALLLMNSLGGDAMAGVALVVMGVNIGWSSGAFNPGTTVIAQTMVGLPIYSGWQLRFAACVVLWIFGSYMLIRSIRKVQQDPRASLVYDESVAGSAKTMDESDFVEFNTKRKLVMVIFAIGFVTIIYNASKWSPYTHIPVAFLVMGVLAGVAFGYTPNEICRHFSDGLRKNVAGAAVIGVAATISLVLTQSNMIYTIVHALGELVTGASSVFAGVIMFWINCIINVFITSGTGQVAAAVPLFSPLAEICGVTQQTMVMALDFGDGFSNVMLPMSTATVASLAIANIPFQKWIKYVTLWFLANVGIGTVFMVIAGLTNYGPF